MWVRRRENSAFVTPCNYLDWAIRSGDCLIWRNITSGTQDAYQPFGIRQTRIHQVFDGFFNVVFDTPNCNVSIFNQEIFGPGVAIVGKTDAAGIGHRKSFELSYVRAMDM